MNYLIDFMYFVSLGFSVYWSFNDDFDRSNHHLIWAVLFYLMMQNHG